MCPRLPSSLAKLPSRASLACPTERSRSWSDSTGFRRRYGWARPSVGPRPWSSAGWRPNSSPRLTGSRRVGRGVRSGRNRAGATVACAIQDGFPGRILACGRCAVPTQKGPRNSEAPSSFDAALLSCRGRNCTSLLPSGATPADEPPFSGGGSGAGEGASACRGD